MDDILKNHIECVNAALPDEPEFRKACEKLAALGVSVKEATERFEEMARAINELLNAYYEPMASFYDLYYSSEPEGAIPITIRIRERSPKNRIYLEKENRKTQWKPKQNRHAVTIARRY